VNLRNGRVRHKLTRLFRIDSTGLHRQKSAHLPAPGELANALNQHLGMLRFVVGARIIREEMRRTRVAKHLGRGTPSEVVEHARVDPGARGTVMSPFMNRTDRLYALVEELHRNGRRGRTAEWLAHCLEVSTRTVKRDILAPLPELEAAGTCWRGATCDRLVAGSDSTESGGQRSRRSRLYGEILCRSSGKRHRMHNLFRSASSERDARQHGYRESQKQHRAHCSGSYANT